MKRTFIYAMMGAIALAGAVSITSCAETEDVAEVNPGYNPETGEVPVNFVLSLSTGNTPTTRMSAANVQATETQAFRGMVDTKLMSFKTDVVADGAHLWNVTAETIEPAVAGTTADKLYGLGTIITASDIDPDNTDGSKYKSKRILELSLPVNTSCALFWGRAPKTGEDANNAQGKIEFTVDKEIAKSSFKLCPRVPETAETVGGITYNKTAFLQYQNMLATIMNKIVQKSVDVNVTYGGQNYTGTVAWKDYVEKVTEGGVKLKKKEKAPFDNATDMMELGQILADAFITLNTIGTDELRAGSGSSILGTLKDLSVVLSKVGSEAVVTNLAESVDKAVGSAILEEISRFISGSSWNELSTILTNSGLSTGTTESTQTGYIKESLEKFPANFGMPAGSALLLYDIDNNTYTFRQVVPTYDMGGTSTTMFDIYKYMYPAELCYFGNSPIWVTDDTHSKDDYPDGADVWDQEAQWAAGAAGRNNTKAWTVSHVVSSTRSVAVKNNINYGTAMLKSTVRYGAKTLKDNNSSLHPGETDATIDVTNPNTFKLSGVIIGGQYQEMGWNYVAKEGSVIDCMIYDNALYTSEGVKSPNLTIPAVGGEATVGDNSAPVYTLVWDNWNANSIHQKQNIVYVALEFLNNSGKNFWGQNGLIRNGETFYITGKLDPDKGLSSTDYSDGITWPTNYALPPYDTDGSSIQERRVFIQDYMTTAEFVMGEESLKKALVTVPDLRAAQISLGLSVDLKWSTGLTYSNVELGKTGAND